MTNEIDRPIPTVELMVKESDMTIQNPNAYESLKGNIAKKVQIVIEVALDPVPGWGNNIEDHIQLMFKHNPYIISATPQR